MNWDSIKGISVLVDFSERYLQKGAIDKTSLFDRPNREEFGYLWRISPEHLKGTAGTGWDDISGILITNDLDARVVQCLFNRVFFLMNKSSLMGGIKSIGSTQSNLKLTDSTMDKIRWDSYQDLLTTLYANDYTPLKRYLSDPVKDKIWIPIFKGAPMDKSSRKSYYQFIKWLIGNDTIILEIPDKYESMWIWEEAITKGPMENPELFLIEDFATEYPGSIKWIPKIIVSKLEIQGLKDLDYFGIKFH